MKKGIAGRVKFVERKKESDTASANTQFVRDDARHDEGTTAPPTKKISRKLEGDTSKEGNRFKVVLIQEGLGNLHDAFYYTRAALEGAATNGIFEGKKIYANHPSQSEQQDRPERSVKDILGHFENVTCEYDEDGRSQLIAEVVIPPDEAFDWARAMMIHALEYKKKYSNKEFVGLSINAFGDADEMSIEEFMKENELPESVLPKLNEALDNGIETIRLTKNLTDSVSVDLVTEAGAGGKILQLMEENKTMGKKNLNVKENDEEKKPAPPAPEKKDDAAGDDGEHDDAAQDKKLIGDMIKKHMGEGEHSEADMQCAQEAYEAYKEMGMGEDDAMKQAAAHVKAAKHMAAKKEKSEAESKEEADPSKALGTQAEADGGDDDKKEESKKEEGSKVIALSGRVAFLEGELKKVNLQKHMDKKLSECGLPRHATKLFTEKAGTIKTEKEFDEKLNLFKEAYKASADQGDFGFVLTHEKPSEVREANQSLSFSDCVKE